MNCTSSCSCIIMNVFHVCNVSFIYLSSVPEEVGSLTAELMPNSTVIFRWSRPLQTNGLLVGKCQYASAKCVHTMSWPFNLK